MVRPFPTHVTDHVQPAPLAIGLFISIFALVALCAKHTTKSLKRPPPYKKNDLPDTKSSIDLQDNYNKVPKSALSTPKRLLSNISNLSLKSNKKNNDQKENEEMIEESKDTFNNEGGLWQKNILMGEKCQPLEYSGVIYYDHHGNQTAEIPRSPRISGVVSQRGSFSLPIAKGSACVDIN
ncbi:hypothetical protein RND81_11G057000 [Saponaria officinalis]|uniref:Uncharacterized protein n=1 Tax=Saponaria officinalis TaxID=3572 RepID=A0AAW1HI87_SAPOF